MSAPYTAAFPFRKTVCISLALSFFTYLSVAPVIHADQDDVKLVSLTSPISPGKEAIIVVNTVANANCRITVQDKAGPSKAQGLLPKSTDNQGNVSWTWRVSTNTAPGLWPITVTCSTGSQTETTKTSFKGTLKTTLEVR